MTGARQRVTIRKLKFDGSVKYEWDGRLVERNGDWLVVTHHFPQDRKRPAPEVNRSLDIHYVSLSQPLTVLFSFDRRGAFQEAKCDAALPAEQQGLSIDFVDLDLDVVVMPGFTHYVRDQQVFAERAVSMGYTPEAQRSAHLGILRALRLVRRRQFPFDGHAERLAQSTLSGAAARNSLD
jgi:protein associated with RNAse G/E